MIRAIIQSVVEGVIKRFTAIGRKDEVISNREYIQHYGFSSRPLPGAEGVIMKEGNHYIMIASDDRRYRMQIEAGEVILYTDEGDKIHLKRNKEIHIQTGNQLTINSQNKVYIQSPAVEIMSENITLGNGTLKRLIDERLKPIFDNHRHSNVSAGFFNSGPPTTPLNLDECSTTQVKGV
jgi:phage gp45-like